MEGRERAGVPKGRTAGGRKLKAQGQRRCGGRRRATGAVPRSNLRAAPSPPTPTPSAPTPETQTPKTPTPATPPTSGRPPSASPAASTSTMKCRRSPSAVPAPTPAAQRTPSHWDLCARACLRVSLRPSCGWLAARGSWLCTLRVVCREAALCSSGSWRSPASLAIVALHFSSAVPTWCQGK